MTAAQHELNIVVVLVNNSSFESIRYLQEERYGPDSGFAADLSNPDFLAYSQSFGCFGKRVADPDEFEPALNEALRSGRPAVVEVTFTVNRIPRDYGLSDT